MPLLVDMYLSQSGPRMGRFRESAVDPIDTDRLSFTSEELKCYLLGAL
jgi:hypothetical protein